MKYTGENGLVDNITHALESVTVEYELSLGGNGWEEYLPDEIGNELDSNSGYPYFNKLDDAKNAAISFYKKNKGTMLIDYYYITQNITVSVDDNEDNDIYFKIPSQHEILSE